MMPFTKTGMKLGVLWMNGQELNGLFIDLFPLEDVIHDQTGSQEN